jgi:hypothetical protein
LKLITEFDSGATKLREVARLERAETFIQPASLGISIEESKQIAVAIQAHMVSDQVDRHNKALTACLSWGKRVRTNVYYMSIFKSVFGKVPMRVRGCKCCGVGKRTFSSLALFYSLGTVVPGGGKHVLKRDCRCYRVGRNILDPEHAHTFS